MALYVYKRVQTGPSSWNRYAWDSVGKSATLNTVGGTFPPTYAVEYPDNSIIDVYQKSPGQVVMVTYNSAFNGLTTPYYSYPRLYLNETVIAGTLGDTNNTLLYKRCNNVASPPLFEFGIYSHTTKEFSEFSYPLAQAIFCEAFSLDSGSEVQIAQQCIGTTLRVTMFDGTDVYTEDTPNSPICGYVPPVPDVVVTEVKRIKVDHTCYKHPVYLVWKNTLGGWDHWLFYNAQLDNLSTADYGDFVQPEYDLANAEGPKSLGKNAGNSMIIGADNLTTNQKDAIKEIVFSPMVYKVEQDGSKVIVRVRPVTIPSEKSSIRHSLEFEISLPDTNTVKN